MLVFILVCALTLTTNNVIIYSQTQDTKELLAVRKDSRVRWTHEKTEKSVSNFTYPVSGNILFQGIQFI